MGSIRRQLGYVSAYPVVISTPEQTATLIDFLVVGGGAGGSPGSSGVYGGGGNGSKVVKSSADGGTLAMSLTLGANYPVRIGAGGASGGEGTRSFFNFIGQEVLANSGAYASASNGTGASVVGQTGAQAGVSSSISGSSVGYGGGGGGTSPSVSGVDGGGNGLDAGGSGCNAVANRGGGGGGSGAGGGAAAGTGGSGVVIIRVLTSLGTITIGAGLTGTTATVGDYKVTTITAGAGNVSWA
jgi:hypothetical protein